MPYVKSREAVERIGVCAHTPGRWAADGRIGCIRPAASVGTTLTPSPEAAQGPQPSPARGSQATSSGTTSNGRLPTCGIGTLTPKSSPTSEADSTGSAKGLSPYWNDCARELSSGLWLPTETVLQGLGSTPLPGSSQPTGAGWWFPATRTQAPNAGSLKPRLPLFMHSAADCTNPGDTVGKSRKIRISPTAEQRALLRRWFGVSRYVYNRTVGYLKQPGTKANWKAVKTGILHDLPEWCAEVPYQVKSIAIRDACTAVREAKKQFRRTGKFQAIGFRSRKHPVQSIHIPASAIKDRGVYHTLLGDMHHAEPIPAPVKDSRLVLRDGRYHLHVSTEAPVQQVENQGRIVALDPGVRTFQTFYAEDAVGQFGDQACGRIQRLCQHLDKLLSKAESAPHGRKRNLYRAAGRIRHKIRNLVDELHHQVAHWLVRNYDIILLPDFRVQGMTGRAGRKIRRRTVRNLLTLRHYGFKQFLQHKAREFGKQVFIVNEAYTSKTCSWSGEIIPNLGGRKRVTGSDGVSLDRDINGARGIFLRALVDSPWLQDCLQTASRPI